MSDRIARSVAFTREVDEALAALATSEGTSRADLVRQALTMLLTDRGIDLDATAGITVDHVAVTHQRNRRQNPTGTVVRSAWVDWWAQHHAEVIAAGHDPHLIDLVATHITDSIDRAGRVTVHPVNAVVPNGYAGNYARAAEVDQIVRDLVVLGGIKHEHRRGGRRWIQPAPWVANEDK